MSKDPITVDEIKRYTDLSVESINEKLLFMEIEGIIKGVNGGYVVVD